MHVEIPVGNESEAATGHVCRPFTPRNLPSAACDSKNTNVYLFYHHYNLLYIITKLTFQKKVQTIYHEHLHDCKLLDNN